MYPNYQPKLLTKDQITWALNNSTTMSKASKLLNVDFKTFKKYSLRFDLYNQNKNQGRKGVKKNINKKGFYYKKYVDKILTGQTVFKINEKGNRNKLLRTLITYEYLDEQCSVCNFNKKINNQVPLILDFIDGNYNNFDISNLRQLCPNCFVILSGDVCFY